MLTSKKLSTADISRHIDSLVKNAWKKTKEKISDPTNYSSIHLNKEASFQHLYALILEEEIQHSSRNDKELEKFLTSHTLSIALEEAIVFYDQEEKPLSHNEIDLLIEVREKSDNKLIFQAAIEFKCYRKKTAWGTTRGAEDVFRKDVYADLYILEKYKTRDANVLQKICGEPSNILSTYFMCLTDLKRLVEKPQARMAEIGWRKKFPTEHGTVVEENKEFNSKLDDTGENLQIHGGYTFNWSPKPANGKEGGFYFLLIDNPYPYE